MIRYTCVYPFSLPMNSISCIFCYEDFADAEAHRRHVDRDHASVLVATTFKSFCDGDIRVDCTELRCKRCAEPLRSLQQAASHLLERHDVPLDLSLPLGLLPFVFAGSGLTCAICDENFSMLRNLVRHTQAHYPKGMCYMCGKVISSKNALNYHLRTAHTEKAICVKCHKEFDSQDERKRHYDSSYECRRYVCSVCSLRFATWFHKEAHLREVHGNPSRTYSCPECEALFASQSAFKRHFKKAHKSDAAGASCAVCGKTFSERKNMLRHAAAAHDERPFRCDVCAEPFAKRSLLSHHLASHRAV